MPALLLLLLLLAAALSPAEAKTKPQPNPSPAFLQVPSPDRADTWPWGNLLHSSWKLDGGALTLVLTYSNENLSDRNDPRREEDLAFRFPTARYDAAKGSFAVPASSGSRVVAWRSRGFVKSTVLAPNAAAVVVRTGAAVRVFLCLAAPGRHFSRSLIEVDHPLPYTLQSLIER